MVSKELTVLLATAAGSATLIVAGTLLERQNLFIGLPLEQIGLATAFLGGARFFRSHSSPRLRVLSSGLAFVFRAMGFAMIVWAMFVSLIALSLSS